MVPASNKKIFYPSKEDSIERIKDKYGDFFEDNRFNPDNVFIQKETLENIYSALGKLNLDKRSLIYDLFYLNKSEMEVAREKELTRGKIRYQKEKILSELRKFLSY